jgi:glycine dehydrogenase subunit 1
MNNFKANSEKTIQEMLSSIGESSLDGLFSMIDKKALMEELKLPNALSEMQVQKEVKSVAKQNNTDYACFVGAGAYKRFIPAAISQIASRFEFNTAYTPYQPEISQGTLQVIYEYQTMIARLTGMDIANASMYDGGSASAEAILMSHRIAKGKKNKALISNNLNPEYKEVIKTYCWAQGIELDWFEEIPESCEQYCCVVIQNPDYYGEIQDIAKLDTLLVVVANLSALSILNPPLEPYKLA